MTVKIITIEKGKIIEEIECKKELSRLKNTDSDIYKEVRHELIKCLRCLNGYEDKIITECMSMYFSTIVQDSKEFIIYPLWWIDKSLKGKHALIRIK